MKRLPGFFLYVLFCLTACLSTHCAMAQTITQRAQLLAGDGAGNDQFGNSLSISSDGSTAIAGA
jgi:hypothetical protein